MGTTVELSVAAGLNDEGEPEVTLQVGTESITLSSGASRNVGMTMLDAASTAENDAAIMHTLVKTVEMREEAAKAFIASMHLERSLVQEAEGQK